MKAIKTPLYFENGKIATVTTADDAARQKIIDVLVTTRGERVMRPGYGSGVYGLLFEPADPLVVADFRAEALMDIQESVSGVNIRDLTIKDGGSIYGDPTTLEVGIVFSTAMGTTRTANVLITESQTFDENAFL